MCNSCDPNEFIIPETYFMTIHEKELSLFDKHLVISNGNKGWWNDYSLSSQS